MMICCRPKVMIKRKFLKPTKGLLLIVLTWAMGFSAQAQAPQKWSAAQIHHQLQKLNFLGSVLYVGAHPDDENTRLISYCSNHLKARTAYLSLTRGDGGQNLIGPELKTSLGMIRTHELLAAREQDGGTQYFTRAIDFGYSKHPDEALSVWGEKDILHDVVQVFRTFKPDIIINRFNHRTPGNTHGHHTASALLSIMALDAAGNAQQFPASAKHFGAWQPKRLFFNTSWWFYGSREKFDAADKSNIVALETGVYYPWAGLSNGEIAALSRSMHKSQGFGATGTRGQETEYLELIQGQLPKHSTNLFEGIDTSWSRIEGGQAIGRILNPIEEQFNFEKPYEHIPEMMRALELLEAAPECTWKNIKLQELKMLITQCAGLFIEAAASIPNTTAQGAISANIEVINRSPLPFKLHRITSDQMTFPDFMQPIALDQNKKWSEQSMKEPLYGPQNSAPYWLKTPAKKGLYMVQDSLDIGRPVRPADQNIDFLFSLNGQQFSVSKPLIYKYNDRVKGEVYAPFEVRPELTLHMEESVLLFTDRTPKRLSVTVKSFKDNVSGTLMVQHPDKWSITPNDQTFTLDNSGETKTLYFEVTPPKKMATGILRPLAQVGDHFYEQDLVEIKYDHIPALSTLAPSSTQAVRFDLKRFDQKIGYLQGAGDAVPQHLSEMGYEVTVFDQETLTAENLDQVDALIMGIRAYNTQGDLPFKKSIIDDFVAKGGILVIQYQTTSGLLTKDIGPLAFTIGRDRVTQEHSAVRFLKPEHQLFKQPNRITNHDFEGWVQERGLYFASDWDPAFTPLLGMHDGDETEKQGALIVAPFGQGHVIYTGLSFFRQLPAGVPGAYKLLANIIALGHE